MRGEVEIKVALLRGGKKQVDLAQELGIAPSTLSSWLNGFVKMPPRIRWRIQKILTKKTSGKEEDGS